MPNIPQTVFIISGESSGELYGSLLAKSLKNLNNDIRVIGVGGERMKEAGVEMIGGIAGAFGLSEALHTYKSVKQTYLHTIENLQRLRPAVVVLIDYPDFNLRVAVFAKELGIKVLYYVSPQVWAWRKGRVRAIAALSDIIAVILPFEADIYKGTGTPCEFVGHPILDEIISLDIDNARSSMGIEENEKVLALLPGSRSHELKTLLPVMLDVLKIFRKEFPGFRYLMPVAPNIDEAMFKKDLDRFKDEGVIVRKENAIKVLSISDAAVIASGTATLQAAFMEKPMVVIYKLSPLSYIIARMIIKAKYACLANILSGREIVREFLQGDATPENIMGELRKILQNQQYRQDMTGQFRKIKAIYSGKQPSKRVAEIVCEMAGWKTKGPESSDRSP